MEMVSVLCESVDHRGGGVAAEDFAPTDEEVVAGDDGSCSLGVNGN